MSKTILLAGATGMFGSRIAHHLLGQTKAHVRLLVRDTKDSGKRAALDPLLSRGDKGEPS